MCNGKHQTTLYRRDEKINPWAHPCYKKKPRHYYAGLNPSNGAGKTFFRLLPKPKKKENNA